MSAGSERRITDVFVPKVAKVERFNRLVVVRDSLEGELSIRWHPDRPKRWRCPVHGPQTRPACSHTRAACEAISRLLLGVAGVVGDDPEVDQ